MKGRSPNNRKSEPTKIPLGELSKNKSWGWVIYVCGLIGGLLLIAVSTIWFLTGLWFEPSKELLSGSVSAFGITAVLCALSFEIASKKEGGLKEDIYTIGLYFLGSSLFMIPSLFVSYIHLNWILEDNKRLDVYFGIQGVISMFEIGFYLLALCAFIIAFYKLTIFLSNELFDR